MTSSRERLDAGARAQPPSSLPSAPAGGSQRWREGRESRMPSGELLDPRRFAVARIDRTEGARFVMAHHYTGTYVASVAQYGLFEQPAWRPGIASPAALVGVCAFGVPAQSASIPFWLGIAAREGVELQRLVLLDRIPGNAESWFVSRALRALRTDVPRVRAVTSHASPLRVRDRQGRLIRRGHVGVIYSALSLLYCGRTRPSTQLMMPNGYFPSGRGLSKIRLGESGGDAAAERLRQNGAPERNRGESGASYIAGLTRDGHLGKVRNPGNFVYATGMGRGETRELAARMGYLRGPYPKASTGQLGLFED